MKRSSHFLLGGFVFITTLFLALCIAGLWWAAYEFKKPGPLAETVTVEILRGSNVGGVADTLSHPRVIDKPFLFKYTAIALGKHRTLKAGEYEFSPHISMKDVLDKIEKGDVLKRRVTIREGLTSFEVEQIVSQIKNLKIVRVEIPAEGTLLPETYDYKTNETNEDVLNRMQKSMTETIEELWPKRDADLPFSSQQEAVVLASIVEKETGVASERKRVAGVFINRLRRGIALQTDPTVIYALTGGKPKNEGTGPLGRRLLKKDLEFDSPYNTYLHSGLPPGPIANPGRAAIEAVLHPEKHDFIYFVADGTGGHIFASTLAEHEKNVAAWRKIRREQD
ncbi:MAG: endolytic transglycosylase MltG [Alphaproteobacteria bacterium]